MDIKKFTKSLIEVSTPKMLRDWIDALANKIEELSATIKDKDSEIERLKAQNRKLQGLPSKPKFDSKDKTSDLDKEDEDPDDDDDDDKKGKTSRKRSDAAKKPRRKKKDLEIDETRRVAVDPAELDASFDYKGERRVVVQELTFKRNNIEFLLEKFYSSKHRKTVEAGLPAGYGGGYFGANLVAFIKSQYYEGDVTIKKIYQMLKSIGVFISIKQINRVVNDLPDKLLQEQQQARIAGIEKAGYQQIDDTGIKVLGQKSSYTIVTCNPYFANLYTASSKGRFEVIMALCGKRAALYKLNQQAILNIFSSYKSFNIQRTLEDYESERVYTESELVDLLAQPDFLKLKPPVRRDIRTAMLVGAFYDGHLGVTGKALISDDAPQFNSIYNNHGLCWYHELRHYKELDPALKEHADQLKLFFTEAKAFYRELKKWIESRSDGVRDYLFKWFNSLFTGDTGYKLLDNRKKLSFKKMDKLLAPLFTNIKLPLTNNESERDIRGRKLKQKISLFDRSMEGVKARDLYTSLKLTCRKNGVSFYKFLQDRQQELSQIPQLAEIIQARSPQY